MKRIISVIAAAILICSAYAVSASDAVGVTRAQFCRIAYEFLQRTLGTPLVEDTGAFSDCDDQYVSTVASLGIISGRGNDIFDPDGSITREEAAVILSNMMDVCGIPDLNIVNERFKDIDDVSDWAVLYVDKVGRNEIMSGNGYTVNDDALNPKNTFHLYLSEFEPKSGYTEWQTRETMNNLSHRMPKYSDDERSETVGDVTVYFGDDYVRAEKDGAVTYTSAYNKSYRYYYAVNNGNVFFGYDCGSGVYNLDTGERVLKLDSRDIVDMNSSFVTARSEYSLRSEGLPSEYIFIAYDYNGNYVMRSQNYKKDMEPYRYAEDENGNRHYIVHNEFITKTESAEPIVTGKSGFPECGSKKYFICTEDTDDGTLYQIYGFDGHEIYSGKGAVDWVSDDLYARFEADGGKVYGINGAALFTFKGDIKKRGDGYFTTKDAETGNNFYACDGSVRKEDLGFLVLGITENDGKIEVNSDDWKTYLYESGTIKEIAAYDGYTWLTGKNYLITKTGNGRYNILNTDYEKIGELEGDYYGLQKNYFVIFSPGGGVHVYSKEDMSILWEADDESYNENMTNDYIMTQKDGEIHLTSLTSGKTITLPAPNAEEGYLLRQKESIAGVLYDGTVTFYDSELNALSSFKKHDYMDIDWGDNIVEFDENRVHKVFDIHGRDTGITARHVLSCTINGKRLALAWDNYDEETRVYDYNTFEYLFTIRGQVWARRDTYVEMKATDPETGQTVMLCYDENGALVDADE